MRRYRRVSRNRPRACPQHTFYPPRRTTPFNNVYTRNVYTPHACLASVQISQQNFQPRLPSSPPPNPAHVRPFPRFFSRVDISFFFFVALENLFCSESAFLKSIAERSVIKQRGVIPDPEKNYFLFQGLPPPRLFSSSPPPSQKRRFSSCDSYARSFLRDASTTDLI